MIRPEKNEKYIPPGSYCYEFIGAETPKDRIMPWAIYCPYREIIKDKPSQSNGYCHFLEQGDWEDGGTMLIWDGCKECGVYQSDDIDPTKQEMIDWAKEVIPLIEEGDYKEIVKKWLNNEIHS